MNVLIVEDEKSLALELDEYLSHEGFTVEHARTRKSAEEKIFVNNYGTSNETYFYKATAKGVEV